MSKKYRTGSVIADFNFETPWKGEKNFYADSAGKKSVIFFLRYLGCRTTQLELRNVAAGCGQFADRGARVYVVMQSSVESARSSLREGEIPFEFVCDPEGTLYRLFDIGYLHIGHFLRGLPGGAPPRPQKFAEKLEKKLALAASLGITHGAYEGCEQQLPAVFVLDKNHRALLAHYSEDIVDLPDIGELLGYL